MKVCIAEKPSVAKEIASVLGAKSKKDGFFEGNGYQVTWTFGHLCTLKEPHDYFEQLKYWNLNTLPIIPPKFGIKLITNRGVKEQFNTIKKLVNEAEEIINCGDAGQEGELIQRWVLQHAGCKKPVKRLWISSLTEEAVRSGFQQLKEAKDFDKLYFAGSSRAIGDWLLGINATRLYTLKYGQKGSVISIGRVQTPTLAMIVDRFKEIEAFKSKDFWELKTNYKGVKFSSEKGKISTQEEANGYILQLENSTFTIISFEKKEGKEFSPKLFDLTSLQVECNKKLNLGADETLNTAQTLYERKLITYPRVDTRFLPDDIYPTIEGILKSLTAYSQLTTPLIGQPIKKTKAVFNNDKITDHHAIIPTNITAQGLGSREQQVYDIIVKRFIANFYPECIVSKTTVVGKASEIEFKATGKQILEPGWKVVYGKEDTSEEEKTPDNADEEKEQLLPEFTEGENGSHEPFLEQKQTKPPKLYTEATLLRAMETAGKQVDDEEMRDLMKENGIGRPSTRANIIQTLFRRKYITKKRKNLVPTVTGIQLIDTIENDLLKSAELTGQWEKNLKGIESGSYDVRHFMAEMKTMVSNIVREVKYSENASKIAVEEKKQRKKSSSASKEIICPKCSKGQIVKGKSAFGCSAYKDGCRFVVPFTFMDKKLTDTQLKSIISRGKSGTIKGLGTEKKEGIIVLNKDFQLELHEKQTAPLTCPKCNNGTMLKGTNAFGCSKYKEDCKFVIPMQLGSLKLTEKQIEQIIQKSRTNLIKNIKMKDGTSASGYIHLNKEFKLQFVQK